MNILLTHQQWLDMASVVMWYYADVSMHRILEEGLKIAFDVWSVSNWNPWREIIWRSWKMKQSSTYHWSTRTLRDSSMFMRTTKSWVLLCSTAVEVHYRMPCMTKSLQSKTSSKLLCKCSGSWVIFIVLASSTVISSLGIGSMKLKGRSWNSSTLDFRSSTQSEAIHTCFFFHRRFCSWVEAKRLMLGEGWLRCISVWDEIGRKSISVYISIIYPWHSLTNLLQGFYQLKGCLGTLGYLAPEALQKGVEVFFCRRFPTFPMCEWQVVCSAASEVHRNCEIRCKWQSFHIYPFQGSLQWKMWHLVPRCCLLGDVGLATQRPDPTDSTFSPVIFHVCHRRSLCIFVFEGGVSIFQRSRDTCDGYTEEALLFLVKPLCRQFVIRHMHQSRWSCVISAMSRKRSCFVVLHGLQSWLSRHWTFWGARLSLCFLGHFGALEACSTECSGLPKAFATVDFLGRVLQVVIQCYSFFLKIVSEFLWAGDCFNGIQMLDALLKKRSRCLDFTDPWHSWKAMLTHQAFQDPYLQEAREQFLQPNALPIGEAKEKSDGKQMLWLKFHRKWFVEIEVYVLLTL